MRTELEFSLRFIVDPNEPVQVDELEALSAIYTTLRHLQTKNLVGGAKLDTLKHLVARTKEQERLEARQIIGSGQSSYTKNEIWRHRKQIAEETLARYHGDTFEAAKALKLTSYRFSRWLAGPRHVSENQTA